jgi:hypothetical protein
MPKLTSITFFFITVAAANFYGTVANAQTDRPALPKIEIVQPDKSVPPTMAAFSGIWLGKWDETFYTALAVKNIHPNGFADIQFWIVEHVGDGYSLRNYVVGKIEKNTLSFGGSIKLTIEADNPNKAYGEFYGHNQDGPVHRVSYFTKEAGNYATAFPTNTGVANGAFDGVWTGHGSCTGAGSDVNVKITDGVVSGASKALLGTDQVSGTVGPDGTLANGRMGRSELRGKFDGDKFIGNYNGFRQGNTNCLATLRLERQK